MKTAAALTFALLLTACGGSSNQPDWSGIPQNQRTLIEQAVKDGDCQKMQDYFDRIEDADVLDWLNQQMKDADCY